MFFHHETDKTNKFELQMWFCEDLKKDEINKDIQKELNKLP